MITKNSETSFVSSTESNSSEDKRVRKKGFLLSKKKNLNNHIHSIFPLVLRLAFAVTGVAVKKCEISLIAEGGDSWVRIEIGRRSGRSKPY